MTKTSPHSGELALRARLRIGTALAGLALPLGLPAVALAADECGTPIGGVVTCSATGNPYAGGITYGTGGSDLSVILSPDVVVQAAAGSTGIAITGNAGKITVESGGRVTTEGDNNNAVTARSDADAVTVTNTGNISTAGISSQGIQAISQDGIVSVRNDGTISITGDNSTAIVAESTAEDVSVTNTGTLETTGANSKAISAVATQGDVVVNNIGNISTTGEDADAIQAAADAGNVTVISTGAVSAVDGTAIYAGTGGTGKVLVDVASVSAGGGGRAINASSVDGDIHVKVGSATTTSVEGPAVDMRSTNGNLTLEAGMLTTFGGASAGVYAYTDSGTIDLQANSIVTHGDDAYGINASTNSGSVKIDVGTVTTTGRGATAIDAANYANGGAITVNARGDISTAGDFSKGVVASTDGNVAITVNNVRTTGEESDAIDVSTISGPITVDVFGTVATSGIYANAIEAVSETGTVTINARGAITTVGEDGDGIFAESVNDVTITAADVTTAGWISDAILARTDTGKLTVVANGAISTSGDSSEGIDLLSESGNINLVAGSVLTKGKRSTGIEVESVTGAVRVVAGSVVTEGENSTGITAIGGAGTTVVVDSVSVSGDMADGIVISDSAKVDLKVRNLEVTGESSDGIIAHITSGPVNIDVGNIHVRDGRAISAETRAGDTTLKIVGKVQGYAEEVVYAGSTGDTHVSILAGAEVSSFDGDRTALYAAGANVLIENAGILSATSVPTLIAQGDNGATLINSGTFIGSANFGWDNDLVVNSGAFKLSGTSKFWDGDDLFRNTGTVSLLDNATLDDLERFENSGLITMTNGRAGEVLTLSGDYVGTNGRLILDLNAASGSVTHDQLVLGGKASGSTTIALNTLRGGALLPGRTLTLVDAAGVSAAGAFTLAPESVNSGFSHYSLRYDATGDDFVITAAEGLGLFQTLKINEGAQALWRQSADAWSARTAAVRDPARNAGEPSRIWAQFYSSADERDQSYAAAAGNFDISYRQKHVGGQFGADLGEIGGVTYGLTGGYVASGLRFATTKDRTDYDAFNLGAYAQGQWGNIFVNALAKYDMFGAKIDSVTSGFSEKLDGRAYGLQLEAGARFGTAELYIEPVASLAYSRTELDTLAAIGATVDFASADSLRGKIGARLGGSTTLPAGVATYYLGAHLVNEFQGKGGVRLDTGSLTSSLVNDPVGPYGQLQLGATLTSGNGLTSFVEGTASAGSGYQNYGGRLGMRLAF